jgi:hypothetical protein
MTGPDSAERRRSHPAVRWVTAIAAAALILVVAVMAWNPGSGITKVVMCDAWSVTLRDGQILTPPPEAIPSGQVPGPGFGPCWDVPAWVTGEDLQ